MRRILIITVAAAGIAAIAFLIRDRAALRAVGTNPPRTAAVDSSPDSRPERAGWPERLEATDPHALPDILVDPRLLVEKERRTLTVFSAGTGVKRYRIALGREPVGDKEWEGDGRTPEGEFYVCTRNEQSRHHRSLGLSYPSLEDADRGLACGRISTREHRHITEAIRSYRRPPWNTALGGEIVIHGGGTHADWTAGCIALANEEAEELFVAIPLGTPVEIVP